MCHQVQAYDADEHPTTEVSCTRFYDPICESKHEIAQKNANYFVEDLKLCNCVLFKRPDMPEVYDHYDACRELHGNLGPYKPV